MTSITKDNLVGRLTKELKENNLAVFIGSGLSSPAGFASWNELLIPIANELQLDIKREADLISLAQYYINENAGNRGYLNQILINEFCQDAALTENHRILARLPINTYWTTNYDKLIEKALTEGQKIPDVKYTKKQLVYTKPKRDAIVYKMHGDVDHPNEAVLIKDDYEKYHVERQPFVDALKGDLISKTFLFLGFSFTDPNLDYILSRVRVAYSKDQRQHYCILRAIQRENGESESEYEYKKRKQDFFIQDLHRVGIKSLLVNEYNEITEILKKIEEQYHRNTIFISGAAHEYSPYSEESINDFIYKLSQSIIASGWKIVSGLGLGISNGVIMGALNQIYMSHGTRIDEQLIMRPFPQPLANQTSKDMRNLWVNYRKDMISHSGIALFLFGNKLENNKIVLSNGMREEFEIAKEKNLFLLPVGATGYMAKELWDEVNDHFDKFHPNVNNKIKEYFSRLGEVNCDLSKLLNDLMEILKILIG